MSNDKTEIKNPWFDDWGEEDPNQCDWDKVKADIALERFRIGIDATLNALYNENGVFAKEYGEKTGFDISDRLDAYLFCELQNQMVEIGRQALMSCYSCSGLEHHTVPVPSTVDETISVLHEAIAHYERASNGLEIPREEE